MRFGVHPLSCNSSTGFSHRRRHHVPRVGTRTLLQWRRNVGGLCQVSLRELMISLPSPRPSPPYSQSLPHCNITTPSPPFTPPTHPPQARLTLSTDYSPLASSPCLTSSSTAINVASSTRSSGGCAEQSCPPPPWSSARSACCNPSKRFCRRWRCHRSWV